MNATTTLTADERAILDALAADWGETFDVGYDGFRWRASRRDGDGEPLAGRTPDDLAAALRADLVAR